MRVGRTRSNSDGQLRLTIEAVEDADSDSDSFDSDEPPAALADDDAARRTALAKELTSSDTPSSVASLAGVSRFGRCARSLAVFAPNPSSTQSVASTHSRRHTLLGQCASRLFVRRCAARLSQRAASNAQRRVEVADRNRSRSIAPPRLVFTVACAGRAARTTIFSTEDRSSVENSPATVARGS